MGNWLAKTWPVVVALGVAGGIWQWGYTVGDGKSDQLVDLLKEQNKNLDQDIGKSRAENESMKIQLQRQSDTPTSAEAAETTPLQEPAQAPESSGAITLDVDAQTTKELYGGDLLISLVATDFTGSPLRHQAHFTLGSPRLESKSFNAADSGLSVEYAGYNVRLLATGSLSAKFMITKARGSGA